LRTDVGGSFREGFAVVEEEEEEEVEEEDKEEPTLLEAIVDRIDLNSSSIDASK
jgi:hypothetical protein